jgi:acetyl esterase
MVVTAGFDPLRDGGRAYADKLEAAGVPVIRRHDRGMFHGYVATAGAIAIGHEALDDIARVLRDRL